MAHIALCSYELEAGGISRVAIHLANGFNRSGHRVTLVLCSNGGEIDGELRAQLDPNIAVADLSRRRWAKRIFGQMKTWPNFRRWIKANRPDILLGTSNNISWYTGLGRAFGGSRRPELYIKTTNPIMRQPDGKVLTALRHFGYSKLFGSADAVLTLSEAESRLLASQFPRQADRFRAVFNPYLTDAMQIRGDALRLSSGRLLFLSLGRLMPQKNYSRAIAAFALARKIAADHERQDFADAKLLIAGEGPLRAQLEAQVDELGLSDSVSLPGYVSHVAPLLLKADRFLLSSEYEGLPAVVIEALGSGCPVISTDCFPPARELLDGLPACKVTKLSAEDLAHAMLESASETPKLDEMRARALNYSLNSAAKSHLRAMGH